MSDIVGAFKSITTHGYIQGVKGDGWPAFSGKLWQRNYYEHVVRDERELTLVREYIINNPLQWSLDRENPVATGRLTDQEYTAVFGKELP